MSTSDKPGEIVVVDGVSHVPMCAVKDWPWLNKSLNRGILSIAWEGTEKDSFALKCPWQCESTFTTVPGIKYHLKNIAHCITEQLPGDFNLDAQLSDEFSSILLLDVVVRIEEELDFLQSFPMVVQNDEKVVKKTKSVKVSQVYGNFSCSDSRFVLMDGVSSVFGDPIELPAVEPTKFKCDKIEFTLPLGMSRKVNDGWILSTGGSVMGIGFTKDKGVLVVGGLEKEIVSLPSQELCNSFVQYWIFEDCWKLNGTVYLKQLDLLDLTCSQLHPSTVAVLDTFSIKIWNSIPNSTVGLPEHRMELYSNEECSMTCFSWLEADDMNRFAAGFVNGWVAVWDCIGFKGQNVWADFKQALRPIIFIPMHSQPLISLAWIATIPEPSLLTSAIDGYLRAINFDDCSNHVVNRLYSTIYRIKWSHQLNRPLLSCHDGVKILTDPIKGTLTTLCPTNDRIDCISDVIAFPGHTVSISIHGQFVSTLKNVRNYIYFLIKNKWNWVNDDGVITKTNKGGRPVALSRLAHCDDLVAYGGRLFVHLIKNK